MDFLPPEEPRYGDIQEVEEGGTRFGELEDPVQVEQDEMIRKATLDELQYMYTDPEFHGLSDVSVEAIKERLKTLGMKAQEISDLQKDILHKRIDRAEEQMVKGSNLRSEQNGMAQKLRDEIERQN